MQAVEASRAMRSAMAIASSHGLIADDAIVVHNSNKLTVRLLPCDVLARVAPTTDQVLRFEVDLAWRLAEAGAPVAALEPRVDPDVYERDGFSVTLWTYYEPVTSPEIAPTGYASALRRLHAGMRTLDIAAPHCTDRVAEAQQLIAAHDRTPALADADRTLLGDTLRDLRRVIGDSGAAEQLLHGEPHPGNLLTTTSGPLFVDFETCCRGPVEFDLAHAPDAVSAHCPDVNQDLLRACRTLVLAMITTWRWDRDDQFPNGRQLGAQWLSQLRATLDRGGLEIQLSERVERRGAQCGDGMPGPAEAGAVDRQAVIQGQARMAVVELGGGRDVSLQPRGERRERVLEILEETEHLLARGRVFHHHETHEVQPQVTRDRGHVHGRAQPGRVRRAAGLGRPEHAAVPGRLAGPVQGLYQAARFQATQRRIDRTGTGLVDAHRSDGEHPLQVVAGRRRQADQTDQYVLELSQLRFGHD